MATQKASFNKQRLRAALQQLANPAKSDLAWLAANHVFFKSSQQFATPSAASILSLPEHNIRVPVEQFTSVEEARRVWNQAVEAFHELRPCALGRPRNEAGGYLNKAAVVYAIAIVEGFLSDSYEETWKARYNTPPRKDPASMRSFVGIFGGLRNHNGNPKNCYKHKRDNCPENDLQWARDAIFLAEIRHAIVHNQGRVDEKFLKKVGATKNANGKPEEVWDKQIWPTVTEFKVDFKEPETDPCSGQTKYYPVCLDITKTIIPYMSKCVAFIDASIEKLITAANGKGWPKTL